VASLFDTVPVTLFHPLAAPHAPLYAEVLLTLFAETQRHPQPLSRDLAAGLVADMVDRAATHADLAELPEQDQTLTDESDSTLARSSAVLRYLAQCGWLRVETQSDFTQSYTFPEFAFRLLATFQEIADREPLRLQGLICAIHDMLQMAVREGTTHIRLAEAYHQTRTLMNGLKELQHNIGLHIEQVLRQLSAADVLAQVFTTYRRDVVDRAYHQLRTTDHVSRFRPGVLEALAQLSNSTYVEEVARVLRDSGGDATHAATAVDLLDQIREVREQFEGLDRLLQLIDMRHSQFVDSAVRSVELRLAASTTTSGQLHAILTTLLGDAVHADQTDAVGEVISLYSLGLLDEQSLAPPGRAPTVFAAETPVAVGIADGDREAARARTLHQLTRAIGRDRVKRYAATLLDGREQRRAAEITLAGADELPLMIYLRQYGVDGSLGYVVEEVPDAIWVERDGVGFRDFLLRRVPSGSR